MLESNMSPEHFFVQTSMQLFDVLSVDLLHSIPFSCCCVAGNFRRLKCEDTLA